MNLTRGLRYRMLVIVFVVWGVTYAWECDAGTPKPVPRMQAVPLPRGEVAFEYGGDELCRLHAGKGLRRPFIYPLNGPSGLSLTRMGHPHDPVSHSHHNSVWLSHHQVNDETFWADSGGVITNCVIHRLEDADAEASVELHCVWQTPGEQKLLMEKRVMTVFPGVVAEHASTHLPDWLLVIETELTAHLQAVTLGATPFGLVGVRMRRSIGVHDGGGTIRNSEGGVDEKECFRKRCRWVDYSGPVKNGVIEGVTLFDHPINPGHPVAFHVRDDGWMGACLSLGKPIVIQKGGSLSLSYGLWIHSGQVSSSVIDTTWKSFVAKERHFISDGTRTSSRGDQAP